MAMQQLYMKEKIMTVCTCMRCHNDFIPKKKDSLGRPILPKTCPRCKSPYWNKAVSRKTVSEASKARKG